MKELEKWEKNVLKASHPELKLDYQNGLGFWFILDIDVPAELEEENKDEKVMIKVKNTSINSPPEPIILSSLN